MASAASSSIAVADAVWDQIKSCRAVSDDHLSILHFLFGKNFERAARIVDQGGVKKLFGTPSGRYLFLVPVSPRQTFLRSFPLFFFPEVDPLPQIYSLLLRSRETKVVGESRRKEEYVCFAGHYCTCYSFFYDVVSRGEHLCCKHQLAARLAEAVGAHSELKVSDEQLAVLLSKI